MERKPEGMSERVSGERLLSALWRKALSLEVKVAASVVCAPNITTHRLSARRLNAT